jgi:hypothetical protein
MDARTASLIVKNVRGAGYRPFHENGLGISREGARPAQGKFHYCLKNLLLFYCG